jgi:hypothetical protein
VRIQKVAISALFGMFDHVIPMKMDDRITIIHGPNGFGKTVLLKMMADLLGGRFLALRFMPFESLRIEFDNRSALEVERAPGDGKRSAEIELQYTHRGESPRRFKPNFPTERSMDFPLGMIENEVEGLERTGPQTWTYIPTSEEFSLDDVIDTFGDQLPSFARQHRARNEPDWFKEIRDSVPIRFIETQRLVRYSRQRQPRYQRGRTPMIPAVVEYAEELAAAIKQTLA